MKRIMLVAAMMLMGAGATWADGILNIENTSSQSVRVGIMCRPGLPAEIYDIQAGNSFWIKSFLVRPYYIVRILSPGTSGPNEFAIDNGPGAINSWLMDDGNGGVSFNFQRQ